MTLTAKILRDYTDGRRHSSTQFDTAIADSTTSLVDLPSTYPFNTERYARLTEGAVGESEFVDGDAQFELSVTGAEGDAHELRNRQRVTYLPNYELLWGAAYQMQDELVAGQRLVVGFTDPDRENGYFVELDSDGQRAYIKSDGVRIDETPWGEGETRAPYRDDIDETVPQVLRMFLSWYGAGGAKTTLTYTDENGGDTRIRNPTVARLGNADAVATQEINLKLSVRLECTEATDPATVNVLSYGAVSRGPDSRTNRVKSAHNWDLGGDIGSTDFTAVLALRRQQDKPQIPTTLSQMEIIPSDTMEVAAIAFDEDDADLDTSGWDVPPQLDPGNTATEQTTSVSTYPEDADGNPDGRLLGLVVADASGNRSERNVRDFEKRMYEDEEVLFLARTKSASNASVDLTWRVRQEW